MTLSDQEFFSDLLKSFRKRKGLTQKHLAERIEVSRETISLWERGEYKPEAEGILYQLADALALSTGEQHQLFEAYTVSALVTSFHNPPMKRNPYFTGRRTQLNHLHTLLLAGKQVALTQAISGLGGIGKTQLALEYAYQHQKSYHDIFWVNADTEEAFIASYVLLAGLLHLPEYEEADQHKSKEAVQRWLRKHTGWLLILDNVEDLSLLHQFVPVDRQGSLLLTTRRQVTEPTAQALELELFSENDALLFLLKRTKVLGIERSLEDASDRDIEEARVIIRLLGNLPLALDQAGAYILETPCSFAEYLTLFQTYQSQLLQRRIGEQTPTDHPESVTATFRLNFQQVQRRSTAAGELLQFCTFLAPDAIPEEIFLADASTLGPVLAPVASDLFQFNQALEVLRVYSLVRRDPVARMLSIHRLVQAVLQDTLEETEKRTWAERTILAVNEAFPSVKYSIWPQCERLLSQALAVAQLIEHYQIVSEKTGRLLHETATYLYERARYTEAEPLYQQALRIRQQLNPEHPDVANSLNGLANLYYEQGKYAEAEAFYQQALRIRQQLNPEHPDVANSLNGLANLYRLQGKYAEAESLFQQALRIREQQLGFEHPDMAQSLNGLALLYREQGKYAEAESLYQQALRIREQLGFEHPDITQSLNNLANLYKDQGKYAEAEPLYLRALHIWEQHPEHPHVAYPLYNLATLYERQGKPAETEQLYLRALHIWERLGTEHLLVAYPLIGLADLYRGQGKPAEAEPLYLRALGIREQQLGPEHPDVASPLNNLANLYYEQGKYAEAEPLYLRALHIREQQLGLEHPDVAYPLYNLAELYYEQGKYAEAEPLYERALLLWEQLGPEHPDVADPLNSLANLYCAKGQYEQAEPLYQRALRIREQLGLEHPDVAQTLHDLARYWEALGNSEEARTFYTRALAIREQALGVQHLKTTQTRIRLIDLLRAMGRHEEATLLGAGQSGAEDT
jgi:tetratricopeptide (TPR) repeat protein/DNA-binding XRE family transcriptional regulator